MPELIYDVKEVFSSYTKELEQVEEELLNLFDSSAFFIPAIGKHIVRGGGKRLRPLFLLASADLFGYGEYPRIIIAGIIEAIHTASLLHDDIVDGAELRRGRPTAHTVWGNQVAVLVGDYLYSNALRIAVQQKSQKIMDVLSEATTRMTEGELLQLGKIGDPGVKEEEYLQIIASKTGALISAACRIGAIFGKADEKHEQALSGFGMKTGMAFQMADDILDYMADESELGKRLGKDLDEGKITMPIIHLLKVCDDKERTRLMDILTEDRHADRGPEVLADLFQKYYVIEESMKYALRLIEEAKRELGMFSPSQARDSLYCIAEYALQRKL